MKTLLAIALFFALCFVPLMAQQTVDPSGSCVVDSRNTILNGQTDSFLCNPNTPGSSAGTWTKVGQVLNGVRVAHAIYNFAVDGGVISTVTPAVNATIPANAVILGVVLNSTTAATSGGAATIAFGTTAGSSSVSLKAATAISSFTTDALVPGTPTFSAGYVKTSAAGQISMTIGTAALTAGVVEVFVYYSVATNA